MRGTLRPQFFDLNEAKTDRVRRGPLNGETRVFSRSRIRTQMYFGAALLVAVVCVLSASGIHGAIKFRKLTKSIRHRATELPLTAELNKTVADLRVSSTHVFRENDYISDGVRDCFWEKCEFLGYLRSVRIALYNYHAQLTSNRPTDPIIADITQEAATVNEIDDCLNSIEDLLNKVDLTFKNPRALTDLDEELSRLQPLVGQLPGFLKHRMDTFAEEVRSEYYSWMMISVICLGCAMAVLLYLMAGFRSWIFRPLEHLIQGSRRVAGGDYQYRIDTHSKSEVGELAFAFNAMTKNFYEIKTDLDCQVKERTKEVVRREQLASVGFLAAGVAHEINNPLASIAWSTESLESRIYEILDREIECTDEEFENEVEDMKKYLRRIQDEAFRCKGITASLLDYSRLGDSQRNHVDLTELITGVVDMVRPLSKYRERIIELDCQPGVVANVKEQEIKQVVLNLLTNALDSLGRENKDQGKVQLKLVQTGSNVTLKITDNGCGMTDEVQQHVFEPFYTRRRDGQGTGLGLSITYRIIEEHGGSIKPFSKGAGQGSVFTLELPVNQSPNQSQSREDDKSKAIKRAA